MKRFLHAVLFMALVITRLQGLLQTSSNIDSLSGVLCPGIATFTCNAMEFGTTGLIDWYLNDTLLARYSYRESDTFPLYISTEPSISGLWVQISSATITNNHFNFNNFTISSDLNNLVQYQRQNLTCGTKLMRSDPINIGDFTIQDLNGTLNVSYTAVYLGKEGILSQIDVKWKDLNEKSKCSITTNYAVKLVSSIGSTITAANRTTNNCIGTECFVRLTPMLNQTTKFNEVSVVASNQYTNEGNNFTSFKQIENTTGNTVDVNSCDNVSITCSISIMENCTLIYSSEDFNSTSVLQPNDTDTLTVDIQDPFLIEIIIFTNSITIIQRLNQTIGSCDLSSYYFLIIWLTIPVTLVILMALFYPVTLYGIVRYKSKKRKTDIIEMKQDQVRGLIPEKYVENKEEAIDMNQNQLYGLNLGININRQEESVDTIYYSEVNRHDLGANITTVTKKNPVPQTA